MKKNKKTRKIIEAFLFPVWETYNNNNNNNDFIAQTSIQYTKKRARRKPIAACGTGPSSGVKEKKTIVHKKKY